MLTAPSPLAGNQIQRPKSGRKPLQPRNSSSNLPINNDQSNPKKSNQNWIPISPINDSNKENPHLVNAVPAKIESIDVSLAEELSAIRQKIERLRLDREKTEKMLRQRDLVMETNLKEMVNRGEVQKLLEIEVDRLFRLKELKSSCMRISPLRSLRQKQQNWAIKEDQSQDMNKEEEEEGNESKDDNSPVRSPSPEIHTEK
ncbi:hypothetical protein LOK49_LG10G02437 [Camellia lanceoleosa]|uniref:Uncharacterized protein n=1 Tax=Camellia lanceoleosa TaxID=1840588 RepID=A0ACC0GBC2_9ERIC|nr:hypothetical protein LOK49_LG10G02437 [Camellia lanceoleosa]